MIIRVNLHFEFEIEIWSERVIEEENVTFGVGSNNITNGLAA